MWAGRGDLATSGKEAKEKGRNMPRELLVFGEKTFKITVPDGAKVTFGPWSPPTAESKYGATDRALAGTLRVYEGAKSSENVIAVFSGVKGFRDLSLDYAEEVAKEEGATIWKSDKNGYEREEKVKRTREWVNPVAALVAGEDDTDDDE